MRNWTVGVGLCCALAAAGCGDDDAGGGGGAGSAGTGGSAGSAGSAGTSGTAGSAGAGGSAGTSGAAGTAGTGGSAGTVGTGGAGATGGTAGASGGTGGGAGAGATGGAGAGGTAGPTCESARDTVLGPIDQVSTGAVSVISTAGTVRTVFVDASAGGFAQASQNPAVYVTLSTVTRADLTDVQSFSSTAWDLAFKRDVIRTNSGDSGPGRASAAVVTGKSFDDVTAADAGAASFAGDDWLDAQCAPSLDPTGKPVTPFSPWYDYDGATMRLTPKAQVYLVRAADGTALFKLEILDYYSTPDGGSGASSARYRLRVAPLP